MTENKIVIASLALDLKRIALAYHRGSTITGDRFVNETKRWVREVKLDQTPPYIQKLIGSLDRILTNDDKKRVAEDSLMYSTLLQNYSLM